MGRSLRSTRSGTGPVYQRRDDVPLGPLADAPARPGVRSSDQPPVGGGVGVRLFRRQDRLQRGQTQSKPLTTSKKKIGIASGLRRAAFGAVRRTQSRRPSRARRNCPTSPTTAARPRPHERSPPTWCAIRTGRAPCVRPGGPGCRSASRCRARDGPASSRPSGPVEQVNCRPLTAFTSRRMPPRRNRRGPVLQPSLADDPLRDTGRGHLRWGRVHRLRVVPLLESRDGPETDDTSCVVLQGFQVAGVSPNTESTVELASCRLSPWGPGLCREGQPPAVRPRHGGTEQFTPAGEDITPLAAQMNVLDVMLKQNVLETYPDPDVKIFRSRRVCRRRWIRPARSRRNKGGAVGADRLKHRFLCSPHSSRRHPFTKRYEGLRPLLLPRCFRGWLERKRRPGGRRLGVWKRV